MSVICHLVVPTHTFTVTYKAQRPTTTNNNVLVSPPRKHVKALTFNSVCLQEIQFFIFVQPVITVMVFQARTSAGRRGPDLVPGTLTEPQLEQAARPTACPAHLAGTVTAQVWLTADHNLPVVYLKQYPDSNLSPRC